jgi:hypothetical protein
MDTLATSLKARAATGAFVSAFLDARSGHAG